jgi:hypothetical protein
MAADVRGFRWSQTSPLSTQAVSKSAIILVLGAAATALAVVLGVFARDDRPRPGTRSVSAPSETPESSAEPPPSVLAESPPPAVSVPAPTAAPRLPRTLGAPTAPEPLDEPSLIATLHELAASDPPQSLKLAREAIARFPDSPHAPEFEWNVVKALANMDRYREAEEEARRMVEKYPDNPLSVDVEHHVLNHPPNP